MARVIQNKHRDLPEPAVPLKVADLVLVTHTVAGALRAGKARPPSSPGCPMATSRASENIVPSEEVLISFFDGHARGVPVERQPGRASTSGRGPPATTSCRRAVRASECRTRRPPPPPGWLPGRDGWTPPGVGRRPPFLSVDAGVGRTQDLSVVEARYHPDVAHFARPVSGCSARSARRASRP